MIVQITFWDHSMSSGAEATPILCTVWGKVTETTKIHYVVTTWETVDGDKSNNEVFSIIRSTITEMLVFGKGKKCK